MGSERCLIQALRTIVSNTPVYLPKNLPILWFNNDSSSFQKYQLTATSVAHPVCKTELYEVAMGQHDPLKTLCKEITHSTKLKRNNFLLKIDAILTQKDHDCLLQYALT